MAINYNPFSGDVTGYGRGTTAGEHTFFSTSPTEAISTVDTSLNTPYSDPYSYSPGPALSTLPTVKHKDEYEQDPHAPTKGLDLTKPGLTPEQMRNLVSNAATTVDVVNLLTTVAPVPGSGILGQVAVHNMEKDLDFYRGTLAHLGAIDESPGDPKDPGSIISQQTKAAQEGKYLGVPDMKTTNPELFSWSSKIADKIAPVTDFIYGPLNTVADKAQTALGVITGDTKTNPFQVTGSYPIDPTRHESWPTLEEPYSKAQIQAEDLHYRSHNRRAPAVRAVARPVVPAVRAKPLSLTYIPQSKRISPLTSNPWGLKRVRPSTVPAPAPPSPTVTYNPALETDPGSGGDDFMDPGYGKIICTMMNHMYGLGEYRIKQWLLYSKRHLKEEHQLGYHKLYCHLVAKMPSNKLIAKILSHLADKRTNDIVAEMKGTKRDWLGKLYRTILIDKPSYVVGLMIKKKWLKPADISILQKG